MAGSGRGSATRRARRRPPWPSTATTTLSAWTTQASRPSGGRISYPARMAASPGTVRAAGCMRGRADPRSERIGFTRGADGAPELELGDGVAHGVVGLLAVLSGHQ